MTKTYGLPHIYSTDITGSLALSALCEDDVQWEVSVTVVCTYRGCPQTGPTYSCGGQPAEGPEFELDTYEVFVGQTVILRGDDWSKAEALFGAKIWNHLYDEAVADAEANPEEEGDER